MARQTPGNYVPLDVNYVRDAAVRKAGPMAELLYIRSLAYAKGAKRGGVVPDYDLEVVGIGITRLKSLAAKLVEVGLWTREADGWRIRSWERWNGEDEAVSAGARLGNHVRWHVKTGRFDPVCEHCAASPPDRPPIAPRSPGESSPDVAPDIQGKGREGKNPSSNEEGESPDGDESPREDVESLCEHLHRRIVENGSRNVKITKEWRNVARLLLDRDNRPADEAHQLIDWCQGDQFWRTNILGMPKFRKQYDKLRLQATQGRNGRRLHLATSDGERKLSRDEVDRLIGPAPSLPTPPSGMTPEAEAGWLRNKVIERNDERQRRAQAKQAEIDRRALA